MNIVLIVAAVLFGVALYVGYNLLKKVEHQELLLKSREEYLASLHIQLLHAVERIKEIDEKGIFRSEDEVGTFFDELVIVANSIETIIGGLVD